MTHPTSIVGINRSGMTSKITRDSNQAFGLGSSTTDE